MIQGALLLQFWAILADSAGMKALFASMRPQTALFFVCIVGLLAATPRTPAFSQEIASESTRAGSVSGAASRAGAGSTGLPLPRIPDSPRERARALAEDAAGSIGSTTAEAVDTTTSGRTTTGVPLPHLAADADRRAAAAAPATAVPARDEALGIELEGIASWYGGKFQGRLTANGEIFDTNQLTAAHRTLPFGTLVRVHNPADGSSVIVRINDRGPFVDNRIIDLSRAGADAIGVTAHGIAPVRLEIMHVPNDHQFHTIQVASFGNRGSANALRDTLRAAGIEAAIESPSEPPVHRVIVQGIEANKVDGVRADLSRLGYDNVLVRRR